MPLDAREEELLRLLNDYIARLRAAANLAPQTLEPFGPDDAAVQRWFQLAIQCCIDLGDSLLGRLGVDEPPRSRDIFAALERHGVIGASVARQLEELTEFRNMLAHAYAKLSPVTTWERLRAGLPELAEFAQIMSEQ
jgi:uncharacterized protein YutE (UPF0331/DUF86 family)